MARRIRTLVHRGIYRSIAARLTDEQAASLIRLLEADPTSIHDRMVRENKQGRGQERVWNQHDE